MIIDHIGAILLNNNIILRSIGRISFPLFAYLTADGYRRTRDPVLYIKRMGFWALISQIPFTLAFNVPFYYLNIYITLLLGLLLIHAIVKGKEKNVDIDGSADNGNNIFMFGEDTGYLVAPLLILCVIPHDYALFGDLLIPILFFYNKKPKGFILYALDILAIALTPLLINGTVYLPQLIAIAVYPLFIIHPKIKFGLGKINKNVFYAIYPVHLIILYGIAQSLR